MSLITMMALFDQACQLFLGQCDLIVFKCDQGVGESQSGNVGEAFDQPSEFVLGGLQLTFANQHAAIECSHLAIARELPCICPQVIKGLLFLVGLVEQIAFKYQCRLEVRFAVQ